MAQKEPERSPSPLAEALESAADCGNTELVRELLNAGADPFRPGRRGETPLTKAIGQGHFETAQVLLSAGPEAERRSQLKAALRASVYAQDLLALRYILKHVPDIYDEPDDSTDESPLEVFATRGNTELVRELLNAGADPFRRGWRGETPLTKAIGQGHFETAQVLLSAGPEAEHRSQLKTALRFSVYAQNLPAVRYILRHIPDIYDEPEDSTGDSPLDGAATRGNADLLRLILACGPCRIEGASSTQEDPLEFGHTALMSAVVAGGLDAVRVLVNAGADVRAREPRLGYTPLMFACYMDKRGESAQIAGFLLEQGAELDVRQHAGCTPLMIAVEAGQYEVVQTLLRFGAELEVRDKNGRDVFDLARVGRNRRVEELLAAHCRSAPNLKRH